MIDEYLVGTVERISPEAPVPVVHERSRRRVPGGAGNVVRNLRALGSETAVAGIVGDDADGRELIESMKTSGVHDDGICLVPVQGIPTTCKTRVLAGTQQICRIDREEVRAPAEATTRALLAFIERRMAGARGIIFSDYDKGVVTPEIIERTVDLAKERGVFIAVDPQVTHFSSYKGVDILTPNHHEAGRFLGRKLVTDAAVHEGGLEIVDKLSAAMVLITRGEKGMSLIRRSDRSCIHIPTVAREVFDVTGAGDTVISVLTAAMATGAEIENAAVLSNVAAGIVVGHIGAAVVTPAELENELRAHPPGASVVGRA
ncbi:MAG: D-glycero-beta-D-manno-heptose-7-phosphate kinase [Spirochaetia bacterium]|nr:D-glycero-beta-D-manno-heptose-7-phosphate kinase [Spirochaetia bacterium]